MECNNLSVSGTCVLKKKGGRKPKCKPENEPIHVCPTSVKPLVKRGRKPKDTGCVNATDTPLTVPAENLIIHLPIKSSDMTEMLNINYVTDTPTELSPEPYEVDNNFAYIKSNKLENNYQPEKNHIFINNKIKLSNTNIEFINYKTKEQLPEKTHQHCQWCTCKFNTSPISLPLSKVDNKFYVTGCFCSFNCALAYNFDKNYTNKWEYSALLHLLYKTIHKKYIKILPSPPKELLKIYGGPLTIEEYRTNLQTNDSTYHVLYPPIISMTPLVEEIANTEKMKQNMYVPLNLDLIDSVSIKSKLISEPTVNNIQHTLQSYMDLSVDKT